MITSALRRTASLATPLVALGLTLAACGGGSSGGTPAAATSPSAPAAAAGGGASHGSSAGGKTVTATETEFHIALSKSSVAPGSYTITAVNNGTITHALEINGPGVSDKSTGDIAPTKSATLHVTLTSGKYEIWCPVADHKAMGMDTDLTVS